MKLLFADDDEKLHIIVKLWFQKGGHQVDSAYNGKTALEKLKTNSYDGLISDVNMPVMNGIELVNATFELENPPPLIVMLTSRCDAPNLKQKTTQERVHLFNKPFSPAALTELIEKLHQKQTI